MHLSLSELEARNYVNRQGLPVVESHEILQAVDVHVEPLSFGDTDFTNRRIYERPFEGAWKEKSYRSSPVRLYKLRNVLVHSSSGVVIARLLDKNSGEERLCLLDETIQYIDLASIGISLESNKNTLKIVTNKFSSLNRRAVHLLAPGGEHNYYHWSIDVASRIPLIPECYRNDVYLVPPLPHRFQWDILQSFSREKAMLLQAIDGSETVAVDELILVPNVGDYGRAPRSEQIDIFNSFLKYIGIREARNKSRKIYIHRMNTHHRRLINEKEVIDLLVEHSYDIIDCERLSLDEQARIFSEASHIIAPHGAGLTNVVYCSRDAMLCELQMDLNLNWLFRRLGSLKGVRYGCVLGNSDGEWEPFSPHNKMWKISIERLLLTLKEGKFI